MARHSSEDSSEAPAATTDNRLVKAGGLADQGLFDAALPLLRGFVTSHPANAEGWYRLGNALRALGQNEEALSCYQHANTLKAAYLQALCNQGVVLLILGRAGESLACLDAALGVDPVDPIAHYNRALALLALSRIDDATTAFDSALRQNPRYFEALVARARVLENDRRWQMAVTDWQAALSVRPDFVDAWVHQGTCWARLERWEDALRSYDVALVQNPAHETALLNRGNVLRQMRRWSEALASYEAAISAAPSRVDGHFNRGLLLEQMNRVPEALESFERAIALNPDHAAAQHSRSLALLLLGHLAAGFASYEWRWKNRPSIAPSDYRPEIPLWMPQESLEGKRLLVFAEQGLGDTLQFCRYVPILAARGANVVLEVQPPLVELMSSLHGTTAVTSSTQTSPHVDFKIPLMSVPGAVATRLESIPASIRYLRADPSIVKRWQQKLGPKVRPRIGLAWSGNPSQPEDNNRSIPLAILLDHLPREFDYFCLQRDVRSTDQAALDASPFIVKPDVNFAETAALCECMDLIISVCTSIAHLGGALGRPLWVLLSSNADWRWFLRKDESPWYPSAKLYRQTTLGDWNGVAWRVGLDLVAFRS